MVTKKTGYDVRRSTTRVRTCKKRLDGTKKYQNTSGLRRGGLTLT